MAVSGRKQIRPTRSILHGSDEDMPVCLPCERGGLSVEAGGFCRTCNEHLCQACYNSHLLPKPLANHVLLAKSMMPRVAPPPDDMCIKHPTEQLEYYCKNHDKLECSKCVNIHHRTCENVSYIQDICDDIEDKQEFKTLYRTLTGIEHDVVQNKAETATNLTDIQTNINDTKASIHTFRNYLNQQLDKMEEAMCEEADDGGIVCKKAIENVSEECDALTSKVRSVIYSLDVSKKAQQSMRIFITMKNTERILNDWQNQLKNIISNNKIRHYTFEPERQIQGVAGQGKKLGRLVERNESTQSQGPSMSAQSPDPGVFGRLSDQGVSAKLSDQSVSAKLPDRGVSAKLPDQGVSAKLPDRGVSAKLPDRGVSAQLPDRDVSAKLPDRGVSAKLPDRGVSAQLPDQGVSAKLPDRGVSAQLPDRGVSAKLPDRGVSAKLPDRGVSAKLPDRGVSAKLPDPGVSAKLPDPGVSAKIPDPGVSAKLPDRDVSAKIPDQGVSAKLPDRGVSAKLPDWGVSAKLPDRGVSTKLPDQGVSAKIPDRDVSAKLPDQGLSTKLPDRGLSAMLPDQGAVRQKPMGKAKAATRGSKVKQTDHSSPTETGTSSKRRLKTSPNITATRDERIHVKTQPDNKDCWISGSVLTGDNMLAVADYNNKAIKMVDLNKKKVINRLPLQHAPWDITQVKEHTLAVTCPDGEYIQLVGVSRSGTLTLDRQIQVGGQCYGVRYIDTSGGRLVVSFTDPHMGKVMDMSGTVVKDLSFNASGQSRFSKPYHISISNDGSTLILSNAWNNTVTGLTLDGAEKFVYRDNELRAPRGVAVGDGGEIYVCGFGSNNIHVISSEGKKIKVLLEMKDGVNYPQSITYSDNKLFVGSLMNKYVDGYRLQL